jgi:spore coat polysaccharide biosynthesis protein SpsF
LQALQETMRRTCEEETVYREHVITYVIKHPGIFKVVVGRGPDSLTLADSRVCVDEAADLDVIKCIAEKFFPRKNFTTEEVIDFLKENPEIRRLNINVQQKSF